MSSILAVGTVAYDSVETPFGQADEVLGGSVTYFSVAASFFTGVSLVGCVGQDFRKKDQETLEARNIDLKGLQHIQGETFRWKGKYGDDLNDALTLETHLNVLEGFRPNVPSSYRSSEYVFLGNISPVLQRKVLAQIHQPRLVVCDTMNYWISGDFESLLETLSHVDILLVNDAEARQLTQEYNLVKAARKVHAWGPHTLVIKRGEHGVLMLQNQSGRPEESGQVAGRVMKNKPVAGMSVFSAPAYPLENILDPTGAGDSFAGGFVGHLAGINRLDFSAICQAIIFGSVMASFNVESFSLDRLKELDYSEIELRYREFREMMSFDKI